MRSMELQVRRWWFLIMLARVQLTQTCCAQLCSLVLLVALEAVPAHYSNSPPGPSSVAQALRCFEPAKVYSLGSMQHRTAL